MTVAYLVRGVAGDWRRDARRLIGHPVASSPARSPSSSSSRSTLCLRTVPLIVVEANPVTPRRAHPETDDKVHPATPAYIARFPSHTRVHTYTYIHTNRYTYKDASAYNTRRY